MNVKVICALGAATVVLTACSAGGPTSTEKTTRVVTVTQDAPVVTEAAAEPSPVERCTEPYVKLHHPNAQVAFCDGTWLRMGVPQTDNVAYRYWDGSQWAELKKMGMNTMGMYMPCYSKETLASLPPRPKEIYLVECTPGQYEPA